MRIDVVLYLGKSCLLSQDHLGHMTNCKMSCINRQQQHAINYVVSIYMFILLLYLTSVAFVTMICAQ